MAIYHFTAKIISRRAGQNAVAAAAYRSGDRLRDEASGKIKRYSRRAERVVFTGIFVPPGSPAWAHDREALWNVVERVERRQDSTLCRSYEASLPHELSPQQQLWAVQDFVKSAFVRHGLIADVSIHAPDGGSDKRNFHTHVLVPERQINRDGFAAHKDRSLQEKKRLHELRALWESVVNRHLARHGHEARIDHRSLAEQAIDRVPTTHLGPVATLIQRRGVPSMRGERLRAIRAHNSTITGESHAAGPGTASLTGAVAADRQSEAVIDRGTFRGGPGGGSGPRAAGTDGRSSRAVGDNRIAARRGNGAGCSARAQLKLAGWKLRLVIAGVLAELAASRSSHQCYEPPRDYKIRTDLHGVGQLPPPAPH
jgi:hypothetical protein